MASAAKRQAAVEAAHQADASAARTAPATHPISVHLTPFAHGCEGMAIDNPKRWATFYGRTVDQVVRATLARVRLAPAAARAQAEPNDDAALMGPVPPELAPVVSVNDGELVPFAIFWDGLTARELQVELEALAARGWRPASLDAQS